MSRLSTLLLVLLVTLVFACSGASTDSGTPSSSTSAAIDGGSVLKRGTFDGRNDHVVTGGVEIVEKDGARFVRLLDDFTLDGAPAPKVGFGSAGTYDTASTLAPLASNAGGQSYALPADFDPSRYDEAYIWCEDFSVALGVASLR